RIQAKKQLNTDESEPKAICTTEDAAYIAIVAIHTKVIGYQYLERHICDIIDCETQQKNRYEDELVHNRAIRIDFCAAPNKRSPNPERVWKKVGKKGRTADKQSCRAAGRQSDQ